jgi:hypothetical protein
MREIYDTLRVFFEIVIVLTNYSVLIFQHFWRSNHES